MGAAGLLTVAIFPLDGALLFPRMQLPLHIFEPRYRAMTRDALAGDKLIAMVQPRPVTSNAKPERRPLFAVASLGRIVSAEEVENGRFNIVLEGVSRIRIVREIDAGTAYRQIEGDTADYDDAADPEPLASIQRAEIEREARRYADALGYAVDWNSVSRLDDEMLVNGIAQIAPLDTGSKQALLEARDLAARADLLVQFMQFERMAPGGADGPGTLQ